MADLIVVYEIFVWDMMNSLPARWRQYPVGEYKAAADAARLYFDEQHPDRVEIRRNVYRGTKLVGSEICWLKPHDEDLDEDDEERPDPDLVG
jgi:hypothetical protein